MAKDNEKPINLMVNGELWRGVSIYASKNDKTKKEVVALALEQFLLSETPKKANK